MISNRTKRNICLTLTLLGSVTILARAVEAFMGYHVEGWQFVSQIIITFALYGAYRNYSQAVCEDRLYGRK